MKLLFAAGLVAVGLVACAELQYDPRTPAAALKRGQALYTARNLGTVPYACVDCHPNEPEAPGEPGLSPAHSLYNAASRPYWYGGKFDTRAVQGAQACIQDRMKGPPLQGDQLEYLQLYLQSLSPARKAPPLPTREPAAPSLDLPEGELVDAAAYLGVEGDASASIARGYLLYTAACAGCHVPNAGLGPKERDLARSLDLLSEVVREGKGNMPGISKARLSDADLDAISVYLRWRAVTP